MTALAFRFDRLVVLACALVVLCGPVVLMQFPSTEEPSIPVKEALVIVELPGASPLRMERLIVDPLERAIAQIEHVKRVSSTTRAGSAQIRVEAQDGLGSLRPFFERLRARVGDFRSQLPEGTVGPFVVDSYGDVAVASIAISAPGFSLGELDELCISIERSLLRVDGVAKVTRHGWPGEELAVNVDFAALARRGFSVEDISAALAEAREQGRIADIDVAGHAMPIEISRSVGTIGDIQALDVRSRSGQVLELQDLARIVRQPLAPIRSAAIVDAETAVVLAVVMDAGLSVQHFGDDLAANVDKIRASLPVGINLRFMTFQPEVVRNAIGDVMTTLYQTIIVVLASTIVVLGWRSGILVGLLVPLTMLASLLVMRLLSIELHNVSIAAFIISLGILVDNGTVVVEDILRRIDAGEGAYAAALAAGQRLTVPLLAATAVAVLAFSPPVFSTAYAAEFLKGLSQVIGIVLLVSWLLAVTFIPLGARCLLSRTRPDVVVTERTNRLASVYRKALRRILAHPVRFLAAMGLVLIAAIGLALTLPQTFLQASSRAQLQIALELASGTNAETTIATVKRISADLKSEQFSQILDHVIFVGEGGPRFILGLNPPDTAPHNAYAILNLQADADRSDLVERLAMHLQSGYPELRARVSEFSMGQGSAGTVVVRLASSETAALSEGAEVLESAMAAIPGVVDVQHDWEQPIPNLRLEVQRAVLHGAELNTQDLADSLSSAFDGRTLAGLRDGERVLPIRIRGSAQTVGQLGDAIVFGANDRVAPLASVASLSLDAGFAVIQRRDLRRTLSVQARHPQRTATELLAQLTPTLDVLRERTGLEIEIAGEIADASDANDALLRFIPAALLLIVAVFVVQFNSLRKTAIVMATIPFCLIGSVLALAIARVGFDFVAMLGLMALAGTIVSNAILVLDANAAELAAGKAPDRAIADAAVQRLRPILVTQLTTIVGLVPFLLSDQPLWTAFNLVLAGGLTVGTLISLGLVPALYGLLYRIRIDPNSDKSHDSKSPIS